MATTWRWKLLNWSRRLWVRASLFAALGVAAALLALPARHVEMLDYLGSIGADSVGDILGILASSMLAVTTFSLAVVVAAFSSASSTATPRATRLLMHDSTTQNALATFLGSFLFSIVGIIALSTGAYGQRGRVVLFGVTLVVLAVIVVMLLRWIDHLSRLGRLSETMDRVEDATRKALLARAADAALGGRMLSAEDSDDDRTDMRPVFTTEFGYIQNVDLAALQSAAGAESVSHGAGNGGAQDVRIVVRAMPGAYVHPGTPLAECSAAVSEQTLKAIVGAFIVHDERTFDQDPRLGLISLSEIASRALSTAVNDPGTAIAVIGRVVRLLGEYDRLKMRRSRGEHGQKPDGAGTGDHPDAQKDSDGAGQTGVRFPNVYVPGLSAADLMEDAFRAISRDAAATVEVDVRLVKGLHVLRTGQDPEMARAAEARIADYLSRAEAAMPSAADVCAVAATDAAGRGVAGAGGTATGRAVWTNDGDAGA